MDADESAACSRFAIPARATLPMLVPAVRVRVSTTRTRARLRSVFRRSETAIVTTASGVPVVVPRVPPPSLILSVDEPGPIGSVAEFARRSCPGSTTTVGGCSGTPSSASAEKAAARKLIARAPPAQSRRTRASPADARASSRCQTGQAYFVFVRSSQRRTQPSRSRPPRARKSPLRASRRTSAGRPNRAAYAPSRFASWIPSRIASSRSDGTGAGRPG